MAEKAQVAVRLTTTNVTSISVFAALYVVLSYIPLFYILGAYGKYMSAALIITPIIGIVLGPIGGANTVMIGRIVSMIITGNMPLGIFSFLPGTFDAFCVGLILRGKRYVSATIFAVFILVFAMLPSIGAPLYFVWLHAFALLILLSPASSLAVKYVKGTDPKELVLGVGILAFIGILIQHIVGSFIFQLLTPLPQSMLETLAFIYPVERLLATIVAAIVGAGIVGGVKASGLSIGETVV